MTTNQSASTGKRLTIALPISSFLPAVGGAEIALHNIASLLTAQGHRPVVISSYRHMKALRATGWRLPYEVAAYPPKVLTLHRTGGLMGRWLVQGTYRALQRRFKFDLWHATIGYPVGTSVIDFCCAHNIAHVVQCVGEDIQTQKDIAYGQRLDPQIDQDMRDWLPRADKLIAVTETITQEYLDLGCHHSQIVQIPNGIDLSRFLAHQGKKEQAQRGQDKKFTFLALGRNHTTKNFTQLIKAAAKLAQKSQKKFEILIVGTGVEHLQDLIDEEAVSPLVTVIEPQENKHTQNDIPLFPSEEILDFYARADCFVMPSLVESFGLVTVEAMGAGLPIITNNSPGCRDVIRNGKDGLIYAGDLCSLVHALHQVLEDESLRGDLASRAQQRAGDFDWKIIVDSLNTLYQQTVAERAK